MILSTVPSSFQFFKRFVHHPAPYSFFFTHIAYSSVSKTPSINLQILILSPNFAAGSGIDYDNKVDLFRFSCLYCKGSFLITLHLRVLLYLIGAFCYISPVVPAEHRRQCLKIFRFLNIHFFSEEPHPARNHTCRRQNDSVNLFFIFYLSFPPKTKYIVYNHSFYIYMIPCFRY